VKFLPAELIPIFNQHLTLAPHHLQNLLQLNQLHLLEEHQEFLKMLELKLLVDIRLKLRLIKI
jgi:hypothetical protein